MSILQRLEIRNNFTYLWKDIHLLSGFSTRPEVIINSANTFGEIPISSCRWKSKPAFCSRSIESGAYISSLYPFNKFPKNDRTRTIRVLNIKLEVELPCRVLWEVPLLVRECQAHLYDFEKVNITSHRLVVVIRGGRECTDGPCHHTRKFSVLEWI